MSVAGYFGKELVVIISAHTGEGSRCGTVAELSDRRRNPSKRSRLSAEANSHHAGEAYSSLLATRPVWQQYIVIIGNLVILHSNQHKKFELLLPSDRPRQDMTVIRVNCYIQSWFGYH